MVKWVIDNIYGIGNHYIFLVRKEHCEQYNINKVLEGMVQSCDIVVVDKTTEGAACTTLLAKHLIDNEASLLLANSDQFIEWDKQTFWEHIMFDEPDGCILTFKNNHPKWSYAKLNKDGSVSEVAEKVPISEHATVGIYYYKIGSDYVRFAEQMIARNIRTKGEFYVCPIYNEFIQAGRRITTFEVDKMWGLGTPEDLEYFKGNYHE